MAAAALPRILGDVIRVTKQDVIFVGPRAGDDRFDVGPAAVLGRLRRRLLRHPLDRRQGHEARRRTATGRCSTRPHGERIVDAESVRLARRYLARRFPGLAEAPVVESRVCQYETTPDTHFVIDRHPDFDNCWLVGGGSGHGFKHGPSIGDHVVGRLTGRAASPDEARFALGHERVARRNLRTGADTMVQGWSDW